MTTDNTTMRPEVKASLLEALRSGEYVQGDSRLRTNTGNPACPHHYCCLGVLTDLARKDADERHLLGKVTKYWDSSDIERSLRIDVYPDVAVMEWAGLGSVNDFKLTYHNKNRRVTELNDKVKLTFDQIADLIEEQL